uniref:Amino acid transporter transmembrane domain-containing protein n=1 Tax=Aegilops tauschii subsp. strangulata TaxID=200361 RepID=A0A453D5U0_AEGTS
DSRVPRIDAVNSNGAVVAPRRPAPRPRRRARARRRRPRRPHGEPVDVRGAHHHRRHRGRRAGALLERRAARLGGRPRRHGLLRCRHLRLRRPALPLLPVPRPRRPRWLGLAVVRGGQDAAELHLHGRRPGAPRQEAHLRLRLPPVPLPLRDRRRLHHHHRHLPRRDQEGQLLPRPRARRRPLHLGRPRAAPLHAALRRRAAGALLHPQLPQHGVALRRRGRHVLHLLHHWPRPRPLQDHRYIQYIRQNNSVNHLFFMLSSLNLTLKLKLCCSGDGVVRGSVAGVPMHTPMQKVWRVSQAIGDIAFAYPYSIVLLEIQDTLRSSPPEGETLRKGNVIAMLATTFFYLCVGCFGYAAFGDAAPGNLLTGFGFYEPYWLVDFANACIVLHILGGYQFFSQQIFTVWDRWLAARCPDSAFVCRTYAVRLVPGLPRYGLNLQRVCFRTAYVGSTTALAVVFPYFNEVLGLLGALIFWPLIIYLPVEMYCVQRRVRAWTPTWVALQAFSVACFAVGTFAFVGCVQGVVQKRLGS